MAFFLSLLMPILSNKKRIWLYGIPSFFSFLLINIYESYEYLSYVNWDLENLAFSVIVFIRYTLPFGILLLLCINFLGWLGNFLRKQGYKKNP